MFLCLISVFAKDYTTVVIFVLDINDNDPKFVYPVYPKQNSVPQGTLSNHYGIVDRNADAGVTVLRLNVSGGSF